MRWDLGISKAHLLAHCRWSRHVWELQWYPTASGETEIQWMLWSDSNFFLLLVMNYVFVQPASILHFSFRRLRYLWCPTFSSGCTLLKGSHPLPTWISGRHGRQRMARIRGTRRPWAWSGCWGTAPMRPWAGRRSRWPSNPFGPSDLAWSDAPACVNSSKCQVTTQTAYKI